MYLLQRVARSSQSTDWFIQQRNNICLSYCMLSQQQRQQEDYLFIWQ